MKNLSKKLLALFVSAILVVTMFASAFSVVSFAEEKTYTNSFEVTAPYSLTDVKGNASTVKLGIADNLISATSGTDHRRIWWDSFIGDPTSWSDGNIKPDTSIPLVGYNIQTADGTLGSSGFATYYSPAAIKDIRFDTSYSVDDEYWMAEPLEFFASSDGAEFYKIVTERVTVGDAFTRDVCNDMYAQIYDTYSFEEIEDIHFIRIASTIRNEHKTNDFSKQINRIYAIDYNIYPKAPVSAYTRSIDVAVPYSITDLNGDASAVKLGTATSIPSAASGTDYKRIWWGGFESNPVGWSDGGIFADTSIPLKGYTIQTADGTDGSSGMVTYFCPSAIKDVRFDTAYPMEKEEYGYAMPLEFYASSDGVNYFRFVPERSAVGTQFTRAGLKTANSQIYDEFTFLEAMDVHYLRIVSTLQVDHTFAKGINRIYGLDYNRYDKTNAYKSSLNVAEPYSLTDLNGDSSTVVLSPAGVINGATAGTTDYRRVWWGAFQGNVDLGWTEGGKGADTSIPLKGYTIRTSAGTLDADRAVKGASGEVVYRFPSAVKNVRFDTSYATNADFWLGKALEFYASSDGVNYKKIITERTLAGTQLTRDGFQYMNTQTFDECLFTEAEGIKFVKIVSKINDSDYFSGAINRIYAVDYDLFDKNINYAESVDVANPYSVTDLSGEASTVTFSVANTMDSVTSGTDHQRVWWGSIIGNPSDWTDGDIPADTSVPLVGYSIKNAAGTLDAGNKVKGADGAIVYNFTNAVKDIRFDTSYATQANYFGNPLEFYASSDGVSYKKLVTKRTLAGTQLTRDGFETMNSQIYDEFSFLESEDIHYVKIVSDVNDVDYFTGGLNRIYAVDYNFFVDYGNITAGDANNDGKVNILDLVHFKKYLANDGTVLGNKYAADIDRNYIWDSADLAGIIEIILNQ